MRTELIAFAMLSACTRSVEPLHVFTAASMEEPIVELAGREAVVNAAASSALARQIEHGARADLLISADRDWADYAAARSNAVAAQVIAKNRLVLIAPASSTRSASELLAGRIAIADPSHVPAGKYAKAALEKMGRYRESTIAAAADVRAALAMIERGEADAGIVYATDAALSKRVRIVEELESPLAIEYVAVLFDDRARALFDRLSSEKGRLVLAKYGFDPP